MVSLVRNGRGPAGESAIRQRFLGLLLPSEPGTERLSEERVGLEQPKNPGWQPRPTAAQMNLRPTYERPPATKSRMRTVSGNRPAFVPVVFAEFSDLKHTISSGVISKILFDTTPGVRSMANYYSEVSYRGVYGFRQVRAEFRTG